MDAARLNFSHGSHEHHAKLLATVRAEAAKRNRSVAVLLDLQGPKIRIGRFGTGSTELVRGQTFTVTTRADVVGDNNVVSTSFTALPRDVRPGDQILLDDGYLALRVTDVTATDVTTIVEVGGVLKNNKGINLPGVDVSAPALSEKDRLDIGFALRHAVDYVALSFVRTADDVIECKQLLTVDGLRIPVIAKIEKPQALERLPAIVDVADGIMVARGDLGVELGPEKVPLVQKQLIELTNKKGKLVITATQMLESMISAPRPTRAEASDVANAVLDGSDAVMLSGETASGQYPVQAVATMDRIVREIESSSYYQQYLSPPEIELAVSAHAIAHAAAISAKEMKAKTIVVVTNSGGAARLLSEYRPQAAIIAMTSSELQFRRLALVWGVTPVLIPSCASIDELTDQIEQELTSRHLAKSGDLVVITMGVPVGSGATSNLLKLHRMP